MSDLRVTVIGALQGIAAANLWRKHEVQTPPRGWESRMIQGRIVNIPKQCELLENQDKTLCRSIQP